MRIRSRNLHSVIVESQKHGRQPSLRLSLEVALGLVSLIGVCFPETVFAETSPAITVQIYNYSQASPAILGRAEREADRILGEAGVRAVWLECRGRQGAGSQARCQNASEATDIKLRILSSPIHNKFQHNVFGFAIHPALASVYYEYALRRAKSDDAEFAVPIILGCVIAHEIGHLLLGSNGHSGTGIMQPRWEPKQVRKLMMGTLLFTPEQSTLIRAQARTRISLQTGTRKEELATDDPQAGPR
jgi:hypothetical protein